MSEGLEHAAEALCAVLAAENAALERLDFSVARSLLDAKARAAAALTALTATPVSARPSARAAALRLDALAAENRRLLERAMDVQARVIGLISRAAADAPCGRSHGYGAAGAAVRGRPRPMALRARV